MQELESDTGRYMIIAEVIYIKFALQMCTGEHQRRNSIRVIEGHFHGTVV